MTTRIWAITCGLFVLGTVFNGCSPATSSSSKNTISHLSAINQADAQTYILFPESLEQIAATWLPTDNSGLIGRNRTWGALYSPRFQLGAGTALRIALSANRSPAKRRAFRAIEAATETIQDNGYVPSTVPADISQGKEPSPADIASGAAFFLGDACLGLLALETAEQASKQASDQTSTQASEVVSAERRAEVSEDLVRAVGWLLTQQKALLQTDQNAPNRLLFNARAFQACGALAPDGRLRTETETAASVFVERALSLYAASGYFIEGGGHDTSYQGVAIRIGEDVLLSGYADTNGQLQATLTGAAHWLAERINREGQIDSSGNRRTCEGGEVFFGNKKTVAVTDVFLGLAYTSVRTEHNVLQAAAHRVEQWAANNRGINPCFP